MAKPSNVDRSLLQAPDDMRTPMEMEAEQPLDVEVEAIETEDGGAEVIFGEEQVMGTEPDDFFDNLVDNLEDSTLTDIASMVIENVEEDKNSREEWVETYTKGLDLLGLKYESRTEPFDGATGVIHPVLNEAVTQFQAGAYIFLYFVYDVPYCRSA